MAYTAERPLFLDSFFPSGIALLWHISQYTFFTLLETFSSRIPTEEEKVSSTMYNALGIATKLAESKPNAMAVGMQTYSLLFICCT